MTACDSKEDSTEEVKRGIGSSGLFDCLRRGISGLYGCAWSIRDPVSAGISRDSQGHAFLSLREQVTIYQIAG